MGGKHWLDTGLSTLSKRAGIKAAAAAFCLQKSDLFVAIWTEEEV